jgi:membrane associated rhomboid family serine protease
MLGDRDYMRNEWSRQGGSYSHQRTSVVKKLIVINTLLFVLQWVTNDEITQSLWLSAPTLPEFWRLGTYMFVHGNLMHLLLNMWILYMFGKPVEEKLGSYAFLKLYILSGVIGALSWVMFNLKSTVPVIGASGAVFGVMGAALLFPNMQILLIFPPVIMKVKTLVICLAIVDFLMLYSPQTGIAHLAHLGGLLGGFLFTKRALLKKTRMTPGRHGLGSILHRMKSNLSGSSYDSRVGPTHLKFVDDDEDLDDEKLISTEIDPILDKIGNYGMRSLTPREKKILDRARERLKDGS